MQQPVRTPLEAFKLVKQKFDEGIVDPTMFRYRTCAYELQFAGYDRVYHCGVGALLNDAQREDLRLRNLEFSSIARVAGKIGWPNVTHATGLEQLDLCELQQKHDDLARGKLPDHEVQALFSEYLDTKIAQYS